MEISDNRTVPNAYLENAHHANARANEVSQKEKKEDENIVATMEKAAVEVALSMNAQIVLFAMDASQLEKGNITAQKEIFEFLSGKTLEDGSSLADIGYEGKPITELSPDEATELIGDNGFFGVEQTSDRVAQFALGFSDDPEVIREALEGIKQGFKEAEEMWGGKLPEISYETQARTIALIEERLAELEGTKESEADDSL
jgi:hypothetical protein